MSSRLRKHNRRLFKQAEGFLELATLFDDQFALDQEGKTLLANRCVETLNRIHDPGIRESRVLYLKGQALRLAEKYDEALQVLEQSRQMDGSNIHAFLAMAWCYKRKNQVELSVEAMQKAIGLDSNSGIAHYNMACYLSLLEKKELALTHLAKAIEIDDTYRQLALAESDFDPIRDDPGFGEKTLSAQG